MGRLKPAPRRASGFASLGSGSRGNGTLVAIGTSLFLIDCGFPLKQAEARLGRLGVRPGDLTAVLVTHEHSDHVSGVPDLTHKYGLAVYASNGTFKAVGHGLIGHTVHGDQPFDVNGVTIMPVTVPHDAREPVQFVLCHANLKIGVVSDLGCVTPHVIDQYSGCDGLFMESNHDREMLMRGRYPIRLKRRIASDLGHLSNDQARDFLTAIADPRLKVVVGHVSAQNNHSDLLRQTFAQFDTSVSCLGFATQQGGCGWTHFGDNSRSSVPMALGHAV